MTAYFLFLHVQEAQEHRLEIWAGIPLEANELEVTLLLLLCGALVLPSSLLSCNVCWCLRPKEVTSVLETAE